MMVSGHNLNEEESYLCFSVKVCLVHTNSEFLGCGMWRMRKMFSHFFFIENAQFEDKI